MIAPAPIGAAPISVDWLARAGWCLSALVHAGVAAAVVGWGEPAIDAPRPLAVRVVMVPADTAEGGGAESATELSGLAPASGASPAPLRPAPRPVPEMTADDSGPAAPDPAPAPPKAAPAAPAAPPATPDATDSLTRSEVAAPEADAAALPRPDVKPAPPAHLQTAEAPPPAPPAAAESMPPAPGAGAMGAAPPQQSAIPDQPPAPPAGSGSSGIGAGAGLVPAAALANPEPRYPTVSRRRGEEGRVVLLAEVSAAGVVTALTIRRSSGHERLDNAALEAVRRWRFVPAHIGEQAVASTLEVPVVFTLTRGN